MRGYKTLWSTPKSPGSSPKSWLLPSCWKDEPGRGGAQKSLYFREIPTETSASSFHQASFLLCPFSQLSLADEFTAISVESGNDLCPVGWEVTSASRERLTFQSVLVTEPQHSSEGGLNKGSVFSTSPCFTHERRRALIQMWPTLSTPRPPTPHLRPEEASGLNDPWLVRQALTVSNERAEVIE